MTIGDHHMVLCGLTPAHLCTSVAHYSLPPHSLCSGTLTFLFLRHTTLHPTTDLCSSHYFWLQQPSLILCMAGFFSSFRSQLKWFFLMMPSKVPTLDVTPFPIALFLSPSQHVSLSEILLFSCVFTLEVATWQPVGQRWPITYSDWQAMCKDFSEPIFKGWVNSYKSHHHFKILSIHDKSEDVANEVPIFEGLQLAGAGFCLLGHCSHHTHLLHYLHFLITSCRHLSVADLGLCVCCLSPP